MQIPATIFCLTMIVVLFRLDREITYGSRRSYALWIPTIWCLIAFSRPVSMWLTPGAGWIPLQQLYQEGSPIDATFFGVLMAIGICVLARRSQWARRYLAGNWALILFVAYCAVSVLWSDFVFVSFKRWIKEIGQVIMVMAVLSEPVPLEAIKTLFRRIAYLLLPLSLLLLKYYPSLGRTLSLSWTIEWVGVATQKNGLGVLCLASGLAMLWSLLDAWEDRSGPRRRQRLVARSIALALAVYLCLKADSMTSFVSLFAGSIVMILASRRHFQRNPRMLLGVVAAFCLGTALVVFVDQSGVMARLLGRDATMSGRTLIWKLVLDQHTDPLFGAGYEDFWMGKRMENVDTAYGAVIQEAHSGYIEVYLNLGWTGILFLILLITGGFYHAIVLYRRDPRSARLPLALLTAVVIYGATEAGYRVPSPCSFCFFLAASMAPSCLLRVAATRSRNPSIGPPSPLFAGPAPRITGTGTAFWPAAKRVDTAITMSHVGQSLNPFQPQDRRIEFDTL